MKYEMLAVNKAYNIKQTGGLTKLDLAIYLSKNINLNRPDAKVIVELFFEEIRIALENGQNVQLSRLGRFDLCDKGIRIGRNPRTKEPHPISARRVVTFHAGMKLKHRVKDYRQNADSSNDQI